jgi:hypothetical protein
VHKRIDPGESESVYAMLRLIDRARLEDFGWESSLEMAARILFRDSVGRYWTRDEDHRLRRARLGILQIQMALDRGFERIEAR